MAAHKTAPHKACCAPAAAPAAARYSRAPPCFDKAFATVRQALENTPRFHDGCWMYTRISDPQTCEQDARDIARLVLIKKKPPRKKK